MKREITVNEIPIESLAVRHLLAEVENRITSALGRFIFDPVVADQKDRVVEALLPYFKRLEANGTLKPGDSIVRCGTATSTLTLRDRPNKPHYQQVHCAVVHYTDGVRPRSIRVKGKWRRAKVYLRNWLRTQCDSIAADTIFQPVQPAQRIDFQLAVVPTEKPNDSTPS